MELQRQLGHLQSQYDMLSTQASALIQGKRARVASTSTVNGQLNSIDDSLSARNLEVQSHRTKLSLILLLTVSLNDNMSYNLILKYDP